MTAFLLGAFRFSVANWKWLVPLVLFAGLAIDDGRLRLANVAREANEARAAKKAQELSDELIIAQAQAMAVTERKVVSYVDRIHMVQAPDNACPADERMRLGSRGVRDIIGAPAVSGAPAAVRGPGAAARP